MNEILKITKLVKSFVLHDQQITIDSCADINLTLGEGEFVGVVGRSGAGKSTILKCINRTYLPTGGAIVYQSAAWGAIDLVRASEREINYLRRHEIGYVSQFLNVMPRTSARKHVMNALTDRGIGEDIAGREAEELLAYFRLPAQLWDIYPATFSGGERLRLNLAHAMVKKPRLLMLDEPTASLDNQTKILVKEMLGKLKDRKTSMLGIFHDLEFMDGICDRIFNLNETGRQAAR